MRAQRSGSEEPSPFERTEVLRGMQDVCTGRVAGGQAIRPACPGA